MKATTGVQDYFRRSRAPATLAIIIASLAIFVLSWFMHGKLLEPLTFWTDWKRPWGILTYPFANSGDGTGLFWFLIELYWLWWVGTSAEQDLGTPKFLGFFFAMTALAGLFIWAGLKIVHPEAIGALGGLSLPVAALTVAWGTRHPHENILLFAIIPIPGWILAWLTVALVLFGMGSEFQAPLMGLFACLHLGLAYLFASNKLPAVTYSKGVSFTKPQGPLKAAERQDKKYYEDVKRREQERAERERLRKLFESSIDDDNK